MDKTYPYRMNESTQAEHTTKSADSATNAIEAAAANLQNGDSFTIERGDTSVKWSDRFDPDGTLLPDHDLEDARSKLKSLRDRTVPWEQVFIALATPLLSAPISAWLAEIRLEPGLQPVAFYIICPVVGTAFLISFIAAKKTSNVNASRTADEVLSIIPDPEEV